MKKYRSFNVEVVNNGFLVTIGCQKLVFQGLDALAIELKNYWDNPEEVEKRYMGSSMAFVGGAEPRPDAPRTTAPLGWGNGAAVGQGYANA